MVPFFLLNDSQFVCLLQRLPQGSDNDGHGIFFPLECFFRFRTARFHQLPIAGLQTEIVQNILS
jgi:hypothetical protein